VKPPRLKEGSAGRVSTLHCIPLAFALQLRKNHEKPQSGHPKGVRFISAERDSFSRLGRRLAMASAGLLVPAALGFRVRRRGQPSVRVSICRVAEIGVPHVS
jgi:hypothetical protein